MSYLFKSNMKRTTAAGLAVMALLFGSNLGGVKAEDATDSTDSSNITINIYKTEESTGTELGTNARARGNGSIATGKNSIAIGKNAVATGSNETKASIEAKLKENQDKLDEISELTTKTETLSDELSSIRNKYADVIEAGERVKQVKAAKSKAYDSWQEKLNTYNTETANSKAYLEECQAKIDDLNSRLTGVSQLTSVDITSDEGLTAAATQLKAIAEKDTTLDLSTDFYKDYVQSYYQALGDLRQNQSIYYKSSSEEYSSSCSAGSDTVINSYSGLSLLSLGIYYGATGGSGRINFDSFGSSSNYFRATIFNGSTVTDLPETSLYYKNIDTEICAESEYIAAQAATAKFKAGFTKFFTDCNNQFLGNGEGSAREAAINAINTKLDYYLKRYEICYYQGQYEETKDTTWLDKKKTALTELDSIYTSFYSLPKVQALIKANIDTWKEENITAIQDKNKVTTDTLTSELEKALGVSKDAITKKQAELAALQKEADQAKTNYESINPNQSDIYLSEQYETVMKQLEEKASELKTSQERLEALKAALTLHDLTNVGENAMAVGTDALATGSNSMAVGTNAVAVGENAIAVGNGATVTGSNSIAIGYGNAVLGDNSGAFGDPNTVYGSGSYAIGNDNTIGAVDSSTSTPVIDKGNNTFVLGSKVTTTANNAVVLGYGSEATEDDVVSVGSSTSKRRIINLADGTADTDAVTLGQVKSLMGNGNAVEYDGDGHNIVTFDGASGTKLTGLKQGTLSKTSTDAVTGSQLYATNLSIAGFAADIKKNAADITALSSSIADHESSTISATSLVQTLSDCKMDLSLANINTSGENKIRSIVREMLTEDAETTASLFSLASTPATLEMDYPVAVVNEANNTVQIIDGENTTVTSYSQDGFSTYSINVSNDAIKNAVKDDLNKKADTSYVNEQLATKANADASNLTESDLNAWSSALGIGEVAENNAGLVNGATVYKAISKMEKANNLVQASGSKLTIGKDDTSSTVDFTNKNGEYRTVTGIITDGTDASSAANVAYVQNTAYSLYNGFNEQINSMYSNLNRDINKGVAGAAALAALHQLDYDPDDKFNFAVGYGHHKNANATALGAFYYANANTMFSLGATFGNGSTTFNAGVAFKIGHGSNYNGLSKAAMASEIKDLEERIRKLEALLTPQQ